MRGVFSVEYENPAHPDNHSAVDWNLWTAEEWHRSWKNMCGVRWYRDEDIGFNELAYEAILRKFGLESLKDELPMDVVRHMSPAALMRCRAEKRLPHLVVMSDTPGDHRAAEEY